MKLSRTGSFIVAVTFCAMFSGCVSMGTNVYTAAQYDNMNQLRTLVEQGGNVNMRDEFGMTPLYQAAINGNAEMARYLIDHGADPNIVTGIGGMSPLSAAIWMGKTDAVLVLIEKGANVNYVTPMNKFRPIIYCGAYGNAKMAKALIDAGADVTARDDKGKTAADYARQYKKDEVLAVLSKAGVPISYTGNAAKDIVMAMIAADRDKVRQLVEEGVNPNSKDKSGKSLLSYAVENKWLEVVKLLVEKGADVNEKDKDGWTLLMNAAFENDTELLKILEAAGVKKSYTGNLREDLLRAVLFGDREKVRSLIAQGADVNGRYRYNSPLLNYAAYRNDFQMAELLLDAKADPNVINEKGWGPLAIALTKGGASFGRLMLAHGASVATDDRNALQPLVAAILTGDTSLVKDMLAKGAQPTADMVMLAEGRHPARKDVKFPEIAALIKPELLRRQMLRAQAAVESAQSAEDYQKAIAEYNLAREIAPEMPEIYYNLGQVLEKSGAYSDAIANLRKYLELAPAASDAQEVKDTIYKLEYKKEQQQRNR